MEYLWDTFKNNSDYGHGGEEVQANGIENILYKIIGENFSNLKKHNYSSTG
jgi:hypothetical protein